MANAALVQQAAVRVSVSAATNATVFKYARAVTSTSASNKNAFNTFTASKPSTVRCFVTETDNVAKEKLSFRFLDLRGSGLSVLERLTLEECLLRHDEENHWIIVGHHEATEHRYLQQSKSSSIPPQKRLEEPDYVRASQDANRNAVIVLGIGGKPEQWLNLPVVREDGVTAIKRFSGGGTVVLDYDSIWTTVIGRTNDKNDQLLLPEPFPRQIMQWTADFLFAPVFARLKQAQLSEAARTTSASLASSGDNDAPPTGETKSTMVFSSKSCASAVSGELLRVPADKSISNNPSASPIIPPEFSLRENDYCLGHRKMGGNAQSIVRNGWLHHTSFLWDFDKNNMNYLEAVPAKKPKYRGERSHDDFLVKLCKAHPNLNKTDFYHAFTAASHDAFSLKEVTIRQALDIVKSAAGGLQTFFETKSRNKLLTHEDIMGRDRIEASHRHDDS